MHQAPERGTPTSPFITVTYIITWTGMLHVMQEISKIKLYEKNYMKAKNKLSNMIFFTYIYYFVASVVQRLAALRTRTAYSICPQLHTVINTMKTTI